MASQPEEVFVRPSTSHEAEIRQKWGDLMEELQLQEIFLESLLDTPEDTPEQRAEFLTAIKSIKGELKKLHKQRGFGQSSSSRSNENKSSSNNINNHNRSSRNQPSSAMSGLKRPGIMRLARIRLLLVSTLSLVISLEEQRTPRTAILKAESEIASVHSLRILVSRICLCLTTSLEERPRIHMEAFQILPSMDCLDIATQAQLSTLVGMRVVRQPGKSSTEKRRRGCAVVRSKKKMMRTGLDSSKQWRTSVVSLINSLHILDSALLIAFGI
ncbi:hypothetical protein BKA67DRAFT_372111 [Truncatella angustata]|uniref:Uncharacterized protein n=1 Tax=Truncatella angustata TaxID=152316 RepID=A0A9P8UFA7_9PEZI|nr:uncharacterized protein BKA67DRAFT_372111 [Truncatella angustata]KAH6648768.1 hypothetical protein BKA67DRAFT_372111 [Truncatella angustata]